MLDSKQIKVLGLRFGRALQTTVKTAGVFTIEHKSVERPIQQSFLLLNNLLKEAGNFTFGFVDNQVMLNNLLTTEGSLRQLETEFLKRGIAAVTFEPGLTLARYKKVVHVLSVAVGNIEIAGGLLTFLDQNEVEGVRILPAAKNQKKNEQGDTILETDSEAYILSKQQTEDSAPRDFLDSIDSLLESGCFAPSTRAEVISNFATSGMEGPGYGVPIDVPSMVVLKEGQVVASEGAQSSDSQRTGGGGGTAGTGQHGAGGSGGGGGFGGPGGFGDGSGPGGGGGFGGGGGGRALSAAAGQGGTATGTSFPGTGDAGAQGGASAVMQGVRGLPNVRAGQNPSSLFELVEQSVQRSLLEEAGNPTKSYSSLVRILHNTGVDKILEHFPADRREELKTVPPEQLAAEYIEDKALQIAGEKLKAGDGSQKLVIEEEVVHVLARSLQATRMSERLAQKLTKFIQDFAVPPHIQEKIREELQWTAMNHNKKYAKLMQLKHYSNIEFRRFMELSKELATQRDMERASALAAHYFEFLDDTDAQIDTGEMSRAPELFRSIPLAHVAFAGKTATRLARALMRDNLSEFAHFQVASAMTVLAQTISAFEDFQDVLTIGLSLEGSNSRDPIKHKKCCGTGLARLLPQAAIERVIELFLQQRSDSVWTKSTATLLRYAAPDSIEAVFSRLISEEDARNRLALVRLVSQLGKGSIQIAWRYLADERWYVVRNMCGVLADLKDPDLVEHVAPALRHSDARVQQAALKALVRTRSASTASVLAAALSKLAPAVLAEALDELMFLKDASAITDLEDFVLGKDNNLANSRKAITVLGTINDDGALYALSRLFRIEELDRGVRRAALTAIANHRSPLAATLLQELSTSWGPLAEEARTELEKRKSKS